jgi:hypothetical protein
VDCKSCEAGEKAGLKEDDVLVSLDVIEISDATTLAPMMENRPPGSKVHLRLLCTGKENEVDAIHNGGK